MFRLVRDRFYDVGKPNEWFAVARTSRKEKPDALQGFHASDILIKTDAAGNEVAVEQSDSGGSIFYLVEEASGVPDEIIEVIEGALSSHRVRLLFVGNPVRNSGFFARSHQQDRASFTALHFRCTPRYDAAGEVVERGSPLVSADFREKLVRKYGEGSNVVRVRADGEFPSQADDVLISIDLTEAALHRDVPADDGADLLMGVDVARYGDDRTVIVLRQGRRVRAVWVRSRQSTMETAGQVKAIYDSLAVRPRRVKVDVGGMGAGVVDRLLEQGLPVDGVDAGSTATLPPIVKTRQSDTTRVAKFDRQDALPKIMRDYLWLQAREWLETEEPCFAEIEEREVREDLAAELASVRYKIGSDGKLVVEPKSEMKKRGLRSPDLADALNLTFAPDTAASIWDKLGEDL
jgi:phage terminase large subunit